MAKINKMIGKDGYGWKFSTVGGVTRVNIESGEDIAHLNELDQKLWTVLSCPVKWSPPRSGLPRCCVT